jgi:hypothetical protein
MTDLIALLSMLLSPYAAGDCFRVSDLTLGQGEDH